ncbi:MAG: hypothetical protein R3C59_03425 [Planctomycetaceae bacterium]
MDAPLLRISLIVLSLGISTGAGYQTPNFTVTAPTPEVAKQVGDAAETYRRELAMFWLDRPLPNWSRPCVLKVRPGSIGAGGETRFQFSGGEVLNWNMYVQGPLERILDSVLPHEVNHTIFACHFRRPLPRWADEGAATLFEHRSEQVKQLGLLNQVVNSDREFISLNNLLTMKEYPKGYRPMLILYAEGYALADFLVQQGGRKKYLKFLADGDRIGWTEAIKANYHHGGVDSLQKNWRGWVLAGMPKLKLPKDEMLADSDAETNQTRPVDQRLGVARPEILDEYLVNTTVRLQSPDSQSTERSAAFVSEEAMPEQLTDVRPPQKTEAAPGPPVASLRDAVFFNSTPSAGHTKIGTPLRSDGEQRRQDAQRARAASFEAPAPRGTDRIQQQPIEQFRPAPIPPVESERRRLEATGLSNDFGSQPPTHRRHLPQERKAVTGSIPQWAGFPGQAESF